MSAAWGMTLRASEWNGTPNLVPFHSGSTLRKLSGESHEWDERWKRPILNPWLTPQTQSAPGINAHGHPDDVNGLGINPCGLNDCALKFSHVPR